MPEQIPTHLEDVGLGWHPLLQRLHEQLLVVSPDYGVREVKEKYGTLRINLYSGPMRHLDQTGQLPGAEEEERYRREDEEARRLVSAAQKESSSICESCGDPGRIRSRGWVKTLCDDCDARRGNQVR